MSGLAALALSLSAIGVFGVLAFSVAQRKGLGQKDGIAAGSHCQRSPVPGTAPALLTLVALLAAWIPAMRAARTNPAVVLRQE